MVMDKARKASASAIVEDVLSKHRQQIESNQVVGSQRRDFALMVLDEVRDEILERLHQMYVEKVLSRADQIHEQARANTERLTGGAKPVKED